MSPRRIAAAVALACAAPTIAHADAHIGAQLEARLASGQPMHQVIVSFNDAAGPAALAGLTSHVVNLDELRMAGAVLTSSQVEQLAAAPGVASIHFNAPLEYFNHEAAEITGGHVVHDVMGFRGAGVTVAVLDSGVDGNHPDLAFGPKTVQNVKLVNDLGLTGVELFLENQANTDTTSGHGTHVAGTVAGSGAASADDPRRMNYYDGIAPDADLIGLGAGEGLNIFFALQGFEWALQHQEEYSIDIITNSWGSSGGPFDPFNPINRASFEAYQRGMVVTFAASNDGPDEDTLNGYAIAPWVINVASSTKQKELSSFSSRGVEGDFWKHPDITAPGSSICSTRAVGTAVGALGPVVDVTDPSYTLRYHCISGTSMATPFVAGTAALLLEANPDLSPDQIEEILIATAEPMPGYAFHEVGAGHIDVDDAVALALETEGERTRFLSGLTDWASRGLWTEVSDSDPNLGFSGKWNYRIDMDASNGIWQEARKRKGKLTSVRMRFMGDSMQLLYRQAPKGGLADLFVDGEHRAVVNFDADAEGYDRLAVTDLGDGMHDVELRAIKGRQYFDGFRVDGDIFPDGTELVESSQTWQDTMGPSAENVVVHEYSFDVGADAVLIGATLGWTGLLDLDLYLLDPQGNEVASGATLANPEALEFPVSAAGTYTLQVTGYISVAADYELTATVTSTVSP